MLGVTAIGSEYVTEGEESAGGRQITTTLTATSSRVRVLVAKVVAVAMATAALAVVAIALVQVTGRVFHGSAEPALDGEALARLGGALLYCVLMALLAFGLTVLTRNGIVPMAVLVANSSAVTVTYLLARGIPAAGEQASRGCACSPLSAPASRSRR